MPTNFFILNMFHFIRFLVNCISRFASFFNTVKLQKGCHFFKVFGRVDLKKLLLAHFLFWTQETSWQPCSITPPNSSPLLYSEAQKRNDLQHPVRAPLHPPSRWRGRGTSPVCVSCINADDSRWIQMADHILSSFPPPFFNFHPLHFFTSPQFSIPCQKTIFYFRE